MDNLRKKTYKLLRKSEKFFKTDMVYLAKGGFWLTLGQGVGASLGLILAIAFANLVPKEIYGNYKFILSLASIIGAFTLTGMGTAITQSVARGFEGVLKTGFRVQLKWSIFMIIASLGGALYYFLGGNNTIAISLLIVGLFSPLMIASRLYGSFLTGKKDFKTGAFYGIFRNVIPAISLLATLAFTYNPIVLVFVYFLSRTATNTFFYLRTLRKYKPAQKIDYLNIVYGKHLSVMNIISTIAAHIDKIFIFHYLGAAQLAIYAFAIMAPRQINGLLKNIAVLALPKFSSQNKDVLKKSLLGKTVKVVIISIILASSYVIAAPLLFNILFPQYTESIFFSQIFAINIVLTGFMLTISTFIQSHKLIKENYIMSLFQNVFRIILMFFFISSYGILGIILAILLARVATILLGFILIKNNV